ncbi:PREDICTED: REF/SRPP-like protein At1g67360-like [Fragaria vesca subsp. vesca]
MAKDHICASSSQVVLRFLNEVEITEQDSLLQALPMRYRRVVDLHHMLGGDSNRSTVRKAKKELKHLRVLRMAVVYMIMCVLNLYECAKKNSGPLRSTVWTMEVAMITIVGPVYRRYKGVPDDFLVLLDNKIDEAADKFDKHAPPLAKQTVHLALGSIHKALEKIQAFVNKAQTRGLHTAAIHDAATGNNQFLFNQPIKFWVGLECQCPPIHTVAKKATPAAVYLSQKYNQVVRDLTMKGYTVFGYPPLVPLDAISTALSMARQRR